MVKMVRAIRPIGCGSTSGGSGALVHVTSSYTRLSDADDEFLVYYCSTSEAEHYLNVAGTYGSTSLGMTSRPRSCGSSEAGVLELVCSDQWAGS